MAQQKDFAHCPSICTLNKLKQSKTVGFTYTEGDEEQEAFAIYRDGEIYGYQNRCPHVRAPLNWQPDQFLSIDERAIQCSMHGALFHIEDGLCYSGPCCGESLKGVKVAIYGENVIICPSN